MPDLTATNDRITARVTVPDGWTAAVNDAEQTLAIAPLTTPDGSDFVANVVLAIRPFLQDGDETGTKLIVTSAPVGDSYHARQEITLDDANGEAIIGFTSTIELGESSVSLACAAGQAAWPVHAEVFDQIARSMQIDTESNEEQ